MSLSRNFSVIATWFGIGVAYAGLAAISLGLVYAALPLTGTYNAPAPQLVSDSNNSESRMGGPVTTQHKTQTIKINPRAFSAAGQ